MLHPFTQHPSSKFEIHRNNVRRTSFKTRNETESPQPYFYLKDMNQSDLHTMTYLIYRSNTSSKIVLFLFIPYKKRDVNKELTASLYTTEKESQKKKPNSWIDDSCKISSRSTYEQKAPGVKHPGALMAISKHYCKTK